MESTIDNVRTSNPESHQRVAGAYRLAWLAAGFLTDTEALRAATGDEIATGFYESQEETVLCDDPLQAYEKSRQIGQSWIFAMDSLARAVNEPFTTGQHISTDQWESVSKHGYIERAIDALPRAVRSTFKVVADSTKHMEIEGQKGVSEIDFLAQRANRGATRTGVYIHEGAYMAKLPEILKSARYSMLRGGFVKMCSTHEGSDSIFNEVVTNAVVGERGERPHKEWKKFHFPWWTCSAFCTDIDRAFHEAPLLETDERVRKFGTEALRIARDVSSYDDFREEMECLVIDSKYSYFPMALIERSQFDPIPDGRFWFKKGAFNSRQIGVAEAAQKLIAELAEQIRDGNLNGEWFWAMDIGVSRDPDAICIGHTLEESKNTVALRLALTFENIPFPVKEEVVKFLIKTIPISRGLIEQNGPGAQMAQWGEAQFGQKAGPFVTSNTSKCDIVNMLKIRMEKNCLMIPVWQTLQKQIHGIRQTATPGGKATYDGNRDDKAHSDLFWALAMMNSLVGLPAKNVGFVPLTVNRTQQDSMTDRRRGQIWVPGRN